MLSSVRAKMVELSNTDPKKWGALSKQERVQEAVNLVKSDMLAEAMKIKQRARLDVLAQARVEKSLALQRKRGYHGYSAGVMVLQEADRKVRAAQAEATSDFSVELSKVHQGIFPLMEDKEFASLVVKEVYGVDTGSATAKKVAAVWEAESETLRQRFNNAGGNLGKLEHYIPQTHDDTLMAHAAEIVQGKGKVGQTIGTIRNTIKGHNTFDENQQAWVDFILPLLDEKKYVDLNGNPMDEDGMREMLSNVFKTIVEDGAENFEISTIAGAQAKGSGGRANRGDQHRALHFKDADSALKYQFTFGHGTVFGNMLGSLRRTAKDAVLLEEFGSSPNNTIRGLGEICDAEVIQRNGRMHGNLRGKITGFHRHFFDSAWSVLNGDAASVRPDRQLVASIAGGIRNLEVATKLQKTLLPSLSDIGTYYTSALHAGNNPWTSTMNLMKMFSGDSKDIAARGGLMADALSQTFARFGQQNVGEGWTGMLANITMRVSLLDQFTAGIRRASAINNMGLMHSLVRHGWNELSPAQVRIFERLGVTERDWRIWGAAKSYRVNGADFLTRTDIREVDVDKVNMLLPGHERPYTERDLDHAATTYVAFLMDESGIASLMPDLRTRTVSNLMGARGSIEGELLRSALLFKTFPIGFLSRHIEQVRDIQGAGRRLGYTAMILTATAVCGGISEQLKQIAQGKDMKDPLTGEFFWSAMATGGGMGFLTDVIVAGLEEKNQFGSPNFLRFMGPVTASALDSWDVAKGYYLADPDDETTQDKADARALRFARGHLPFVNLWYLSAIIDRAAYNDWMNALSPGYSERLEAWNQRFTGQEYWWSPYEITPERMPRIAEQPEQE